MDFLHRNFLAEELKKWQAQGLIAKHQADAIATSYGIDLNDLNSRTNAILRLVAYFFFGCALMVLVGANWEEMPRFVRLVLLIALTTVVNLGAFLQLRAGNEKYAEALFFLATLIFGASIALIAQVYHLGRHMPDGVLLWAIGAFSTALLVRKSTLGGLALLIALLWFFMESSLGGARPVSFLLFIALAIFIAYFDSGRLIMGAIFVSIYCYLFDIERFEFMNMALNFAYCIFGVALSHVLLKFGRMQGALGLHSVASFAGIGLLFFAVVLGNEIFFGYETGMSAFQGVSEYLKWLFSSYSGLLMVLFCAGSVAVGLWCIRYTLVLVAVLCFALPFLQILGVDGRVIYSFVAVIVGGVFIKIGQLGTGLALIFTVAVVRYFELVGDYIGASVLFLVFAVIMLVLVRKRRAK